MVRKPIRLQGSDFDDIEVVHDDGLWVRSMNAGERYLIKKCGKMFCIRKKSGGAVIKKAMTRGNAIQAAKELLEKDWRRFLKTPAGRRMVSEYMKG